MALTKMSVVLVRFAVAFLAHVNTLWRGLFWRRARLQMTLNMVVASGDGVRSATFMRIVLSTGHNTSIFVVLPSWWHVATSTSVKLVCLERQIFSVLAAMTRNAYPSPQLSQQLNRSSADIWIWSLPLVLTQILSVMASAAPKAFIGKIMFLNDFLEQI